MWGGSQCPGERWSREGAWFSGEGAARAAVTVGSPCSLQDRGAHTPCTPCLARRGCSVSAGLSGWPPPWGQPSPG